MQSFFLYVLCCQSILNCFMLFVCFICCLLLTLSSRLSLFSRCSFISFPAVVHVSAHWLLFVLSMPPSLLPLLPSFVSPFHLSLQAIWALGRALLGIEGLDSMSSATAVSAVSAVISVSIVVLSNAKYAMWRILLLLLLGSAVGMPVGSALFIMANELALTD